MTNSREYKVNLSSLFLSSLGLIHAIAFWSYYVQFPGLLSASGIEPVHRLLPYAAPTLHRLGWTDDDSLCELVAILGMILGTVIWSGVCQHGLLFGLQAALYSVLVRSGGTFYSFQWDTLLLETTAITALTYAPWLRLRPTVELASSLAPWPLRFLLFKLMYMSGVVKLQANCPTWLNLTALEYHFGTQCLPGPLAWHAQQMHPFLLRFGVAVTLWLEIPATLMLLIPSKTVRRTGALLQLVLQVMIILTGSYNFFNLLTMALCIPVMEEAVSSNKTPRHRTFLWYMACWIYALWTFLSMFEISTVEETLSIRLLKAPQEVDGYTETIIPLVLYTVTACMAFQTLRHTISRRSPFVLVHGIVCLGVIGLVALPLFSLTPKLQQRGFVGSQKLFTPLHQTYARPYHLANGYGLFRRMTGVSTTTNATQGWAGLPPSVVARPEIILEARLEGSEDEWHELNFRWKPGNETFLPQQVAPHQPRLDWQMWFAALGTLSNNPWLIHLVKKLLDGCEPVLDLLGDSALTGRKVLQIRAKVYHYDFTRIESDWSETIPGAEILPANGSFWSQVLTKKPAKVWHRTLGHDYMPHMEADNPSLIQYVESHGYKSVCIDSKDRCRQEGNTWCWIAKTIRERRLHLLIPFLFVVLVLSRVLGQRLTQRRGRSKVSLQKKNQ